MAPELTDLASLFGSLASVLPESEKHSPSHLALSEHNLPVPPPALVTSALCATWGYHFYGDVPIEAVSFEADKVTYRHLALLILASVFHRQPERVTLFLTHPRATLDRLIVGHDWDGTDHPGYLERPLRFNYYPDRASRHPWLFSAVSPRDLPMLFLTNEREVILGPDDLPSRHVGVGFGSSAAAALLAELLLNASLPSNEELEFELEGEMGFRGVGPGSAEIKIWLPGGIGHLDSEPRDADRGGAI